MKITIFQIHTSVVPPGLVVGFAFGSPWMNPWAMFKDSGGGNPAHE